MLLIILPLMGRLNDVQTFKSSLGRGKEHSGTLQQKLS